MGMKPLTLDYAEFYITNVCNLTCHGCNRFNDKKFKGWQDWDEFADIYKQWSEVLDLKAIAIMGGEPLLNPTFNKWITGIAKLWPGKIITITTNGTQLDRHPDLYDILATNKNLNLNISLHSKITKQEIIDKAKKLLVEPIVSTFDNTPYREVLTLTDSNGVQIVARYNWWFHQGAVTTDVETGQYTLHQSDPLKAHAICHSTTCHHFDHGRLYKCGPSALFPEFDKQFKLKLSDSDRQLMNSVQSLGIDDPLELKQAFIDKIKDPIPQCRFCPESYHGQQIFSIEKKDMA